MKYEIITPDLFNKVSRENEYWLWHIVPKKYPMNLEILPLSVDANPLLGYNPFKLIINQLQVPVFETRVDGYLDYFSKLPNPIGKHYSNEDAYGISLIGMNYSTIITSTLHPGKCYCIAGVLEIISELDVKLLGSI